MPGSFPHTTWWRVERCFRTQRQQTSVWLPACCEILRIRVCSADSFLPHARTHKRMTRVSSAKHELRNIFWLQIPGTCQLDAATLGPWAAKRSQKTWCWQLWIGYSLQGCAISPRLFDSVMGTASSSSRAKLEAGKLSLERGLNPYHLMMAYLQYVLHNVGQGVPFVGWASYSYLFPLHKQTWH